MESDKPADRKEKDFQRRGTVLGYWMTIMAEAQASASRARKAYEEDDSHGEAWGTASAILCACAALEAMLSEERTSDDYPSFGPRNYVKEIRKQSGAADRWNRFMRARVRDFNPGESTEFDSLQCLFRVRNLIAHRRARWMRAGEWPPPIADCILQGAVSVPNIKGRIWASVLFTARVAEWACEEAENWIEFVLPYMPHARSVRSVHNLRRGYGGENSS